LIATKGQREVDFVGRLVVNVDVELWRRGNRSASDGLEFALDHRAGILEQGAPKVFISPRAEDESIFEAGAGDVRERGWLRVLHGASPDIS
jgi:hypothetical protein